MVDETVSKAIDSSVQTRVDDVAIVAAAQVDQANKDAEAIARAAIQGEHASRVAALEGNIVSWQSTSQAFQEETRAQLTQMKEQQAALLASIQLQSAPPPPPPVVVEAPAVDPKSEGGPLDGEKTPKPSSDPKPPGRVRKIL